MRIVLGGGGGGITVEFLQKTQVFCFRAQELQLFTSRGGETAVVSPEDGWEQTLESTVFEDAGSHLPEVRGHLLGSLPDSSLSTKGCKVQQAKHRKTESPGLVWERKREEKLVNFNVIELKSVL